MGDQITTTPRQWNEVTLGEMVSLSKSQWNPGDTEQKYIGLEHINPGQLTINGYGESSALASNKFHFNEGDVLFGKLRPYFRKVWKAKFQGICSTDIWVLKSKPGFDQDFLFYFVATPLFIGKSMGANIGTHMPRADWHFLEQTKWTVPTLSEQRAIVAVLSSLDEKVELLREQNKTLEAIAKAIFKEWFVNFDFPGRDGKPYKLNSGKMIASELGEIPDGWRVGTVDSFIERNKIPYRCIKSDLSKRGKIPIIDQGADGLYGYTERNPDFQASSENPVILFTNHTCNMWFVNYPFCAIQNIIPFRGNSEYSTFFVYYMTLGRMKFIEYKGHWPDFAQKKYIIPVPELANKFAEIVKPIQHKIWCNNSQTQTLTTLRDTLLPKLLKGEIRLAGFKDKL